MPPKLNSEPIKAPARHKVAKEVNKHQNLFRSHQR